MATRTVGTLEMRGAWDVNMLRWSSLNRVQEDLLLGGLSHRAASGRRTRAITSISQDVQVTGRVWEVAEEVWTA